MLALLRMHSPSPCFPYGTELNPAELYCPPMIQEINIYVAVSQTLTVSVCGGGQDVTGVLVLLRHFNGSYSGNL